MSYLYVIGPDPYECAQSHHTRGNGKWSTEAADVSTALNSIFSTMSFPGEAAGREHFIDGVSLPGVDGGEVIQVWSSEAVAVDRAGKMTRHTGRGKNIGLLKEIRVTEIVTFTPAGRKLLADPNADANQKALSPIGASVSNLAARRYELHQHLQATQHSVSAKLLELDEARESMNEQKKKIEAQIELMQTYLHGIQDTTWLARGSRAPANQPYKIFQNRQFLNREVALLANLTDLDFRDMEGLNKWIVKSGQIWKLLPFDKTILVTRIRDEEKSYGSPISDWAMNELNFKNIIWIRDGENVVQLTVDTDFENAVFPSKKEEDSLFTYVKDHVWAHCFKAHSEPKYGLKAHAIKQRSPCELREVTLHRFKTLQEWFDGEEYAKLEPEINERAFTYLREKNQDRMLFLVLMQGIVDNTDVLTIPTGTDLFRHEVCEQYFELIYDYSHGLPDKSRPAAIAPYFSHVVKGQWIIAAFVSREELGRTTWRRGYSEPTLFQVAKLSPAGKPVVRFRRKAKHRCYGSYRVANATLTEVEGPWMRMDLPSKLAADILDVRDWKIENAWVVPLLAQWKTVQKRYLTSPADHVEIELNEAEAI